MHTRRAKINELYTGGYYLPLSDNAVRQIHETSMSVFEEVGVKIAYRSVLNLWRKAGAEIDDDSNTARISRHAIKKILSTAPSEIKLCGRTPENDIVLSGTNTYLGSGGTALNIIDPVTRKRRETTIGDVAASAKIIDACKNIDFYVIACYPTELNKEVVDINRFYAAIQNTSKHVMGGVYTKDGIRKVARMAEILAGSKDAFRQRPFISMITSIMSPLVFDDHYTQLMETACEMGFPLATSTAPMAGTTAPMTMAGTLVQMNVEALSGVITTQLMDPGHATLYSVVPTMTDLRTGTFCFGSVEMGMMNAAASQLARFYKLPIYNTAGPSESKVPDVQSAYEASVSIMLTALAGSNYIHEAAGILESGLTISLENYVVNDEIIGMVKRVLKGIEVDEERLALECIKRVRPGGTYISDDLTMKFMRSEAFYPALADRMSRQSWEANGAQTTIARAHQVALHLLQHHTVIPIDSALDKKIRTEFPEISNDNKTI